MQTLIVDEPIRPRDGYEADCLRWRFFEAAYRGGAAFKDAVDAVGQPVLVRHEREYSAAKYARRKRLASYLNLCAPTVNQYLAYVFRKEADRSLDPALHRWGRNVDRRGTPLHSFMREAMTWAVIKGTVWVGINSPVTEPAQMTALQRREAGLEPYLTLNQPESVIDLEEDDGRPARLVVRYRLRRKAGLFEESEVEEFLDEWFPDHYVRWRGRVRDGRCVWSGEPRPHSFGCVPFVRIAPWSGKSFLSDLAEINQEIFNLCSLLNEELYSRVFTLYVALNVAPPDEDARDVTVGSDNILYLNGEQGTAEFKAVGSSGDSEKILRAILWRIACFYQAAGLRTDSYVGEGRAAASGLSKAYDFQHAEVVMAAIADAAEQAENALLRIWAGQEGLEPERIAVTHYPDDFNVSSFQRELRDLSAIVSLGIPLPPEAERGILRAALLRKFAGQSWLKDVPGLSPDAVQTGEL